MEYARPTLHVVGTAQALVLGGIVMLPSDSPVGGPNTTPGLEVLGLDE
jgi:hypothetical protein